MAYLDWFSVAIQFFYNETILMFFVEWISLAHFNLFRLAPIETNFQNPEK